MLEIPTLEDVVGRLEEMTGLDHIDVHAPVMTLGIDSLDFVEWLYWLEDEYGYVFDESLVDHVEDLSIASVFHSALVTASLALSRVQLGDAV